MRAGTPWQRLGSPWQGVTPPAHSVRPLDDYQLMAPLVQELGRDGPQIAARATVVIDTFL